MKRTGVLILAVLFLITALQVTAYADSISIYFEGGYVETEVAPVIKNDRTFVPIALIAHMLGAETEWIEGGARQVKITQGENTLSLFIDSTYMEYNGATLHSDVPPFIEQDRTMVPLRIISEYLGFDVNYNGLLRRVDINRHKTVFYRIENGRVDIYGKYSPTHDIMVRIEPCGTNKVPDFSAVYLIRNGGSDISRNLEDAVAIYKRNSDWHSPFIVNAKENAFSDNRFSFTGGNHGYNNNGSGAQTANRVFFWIEADGIAVDKGYGYCSKLVINWKNAVQGSNTKEPSGWGRAIMEESHTLTFDGYEFVSEVTLMPLEDIDIYRIYGFSAEIKNVWDNTVEYDYSIYKESKPGTESSEAAEKNCKAITCRRGSNALRISLDTDYGLGTREYLESGRHSAFAESYGKVYFDIVDGITIEAAKGEPLYYRGAYKFFYEG
ncbi:MAG: copper amine oxidase N-terminal domain-containing protein [Clostridia bacterium]|nr:copper amine oxidase N-terminal domain-containing protein [Clostridia bacterium]